MIDLPLAEVTDWYTWFWKLLNWGEYLLRDIEDIWSVMNVRLGALDSFLSDEFAINAKWLDLFVDALDAITSVFGFTISQYCLAELVIGGGFFIVFLSTLIAILTNLVKLVSVAK
jgi:hypothetical protein